ncbi:IPExxxVDY family protein [Catalinimonas niigatensis]|uniref:IPExxxVDY family protein n=1 Tax=Catalinimonas niigatensis TaxID=1397264 RepID=UPI0026652E8E|nr:IPExxxVDY family protein [Catalinimonas niigatensis]WPP50220.1 IPExxxVDY family protein [Catalinimonas niigatensis]
MSTRRELQLAIQYNLDLLGLVSSAKEYKLAWSLNQILGLKLAKSEDLAINFIEGRSIIISNFTFTTSHCTFRLLKNRAFSDHSNAFLLPELKNIDYFLLIKNESDTFELNTYVDRLPQIDIVQSFTSINVENLENKENLIF